MTNLTEILTLKSRCENALEKANAEWHLSEAEEKKLSAEFDKAVTAEDQEKVRCKCRKAREKSKKASAKWHKADAQERLLEKCLKAYEDYIRAEVKLDNDLTSHNEKAWDNAYETFYYAKEALRESLQHNLED